MSQLIGRRGAIAGGRQLAGPAGPTFSGVVSGERASAGTLSLTPPAGDFWIALVSHVYGDVTIPAGWTNLYGADWESEHYVLVRDTTPNTNWSVLDQFDDNYNTVIMVAGYSGVENMEHDIDDNDTPVCPSITSAADDLIVRTFMSIPQPAGQTLGYPTAATLDRHQEVATISTIGTNMVGVAHQIATGSSTGTATWVPSTVYNPIVGTFRLIGA